MLTASLFDAKYQGSNGVWHNTDYNGKYAVNGVFAYEFEINKKQSINIGSKITFAGGRWHGEIDTLTSSFTKIVTYKNNENYNEFQFKPYFRADLKLNYKINAHRITHEIGFDLVNVLDTKNVLRYSWVPVPTNPSQGSVKEENQLGFLPLFYYRIDFGFK